MKPALRVLVLEDNEDIARWLSPALEFLGGYKVEVLTWGFEQALEEDFGWDRFDVLLTDWMVPGFEVKGLLLHLKEKHPSVRRVIFTAAYPDEVDQTLAHETIYKGVQMSEILKAIQGF